MRPTTHTHTNTELVSDPHTHLHTHAYTEFISDPHLHTSTCRTYGTPLYKLTHITYTLNLVQTHTHTLSSPRLLKHKHTYTHTPSPPRSPKHTHAHEPICK